MPNDPVRIGLVFSPKGLVNIAIVAGDYGRGCDYILEIRPLIDEFLRQVKTHTIHLPARSRRTSLTTPQRGTQK